ncbi:MAG: 1-acyl-sn-glycerol-3-phosphate acyltransferase [Ilumatobacteraceae bacterium]|jgi:1-acyl-sn-glycerol-3-phosphate acyltransferase|nr:1-acyl-sn-glycerol-3-phosphate acyltransferase [Ilumatobacteraceae bacterium]
MAEVDTRLIGQSRTSKMLYTLIRGLVVGLCVGYTRTKVVGKHNIPSTGAFLLAPIHRSNIDTPLAAAVTRRRLRFMGKDTIWKIKPIGWIISALGAFPVTRGTADREALKRCVAVLEAGEPLVLFPEGTRQSGPIVQPLFDGAAYVAVKAGVPIIPVGIGGSEGVMPKGSKMIYPRKCVVVVGEPILAPLDASGKVPRSAVKDVTEMLSQELQRLFNEAQSLAGTPNS